MYHKTYVILDRGDFGGVILDWGDFGWGDCGGVIMSGVILFGVILSAHPFIKLAKNVHLQSCEC